MHLCVGDVITQHSRGLVGGVFFTPLLAGPVNTLFLRRCAQRAMRSPQKQPGGLHNCLIGPIGGSLSAQIASLVLIARELRSDSSPRLQEMGWDWVRYRDNFLIHMSVQISGDAVTDTVMRRQADFAMALLNSVFGMELQLEQWGAEIDFLGGKLCSNHFPRSNV